MLIIPAIDLYQGGCVRLKQGEFSDITQFSQSPIERAAYFAKAGASVMHVVDLDGARMGAMQQLPLISAMNAPGLIVQAGGGIRTLAQAQDCLDAGIVRLVLGSIALTNPQLTLEIIETIGAERIVLALDVRITDSVAVPAINGWEANSSKTLWQVVDYYQDCGIKNILCTDIACDGMMNGPNFDLYEQAIARFPAINWQASGGVRHDEDLKRLADLGLHGAILGLTLYQNNIDLAQAIVNYQTANV